MNQTQHGRKPGGTRSRILAAALEEFSAKGLSGARTQRIARNAGISERMLFYHFASKDGLFRAALDGALESLEKAAHALDFSGIAPEKGVKHLTAFICDYYRDHADLWSLLNDSDLRGAQQFKESQRRPVMAFLEALTELLQRGKRDRLFRDDVDPVRLYAIVSGLAHYAISNRFTLEATLGIDINDPDEEKRIRDLHTEVIIDYLSAHRCVSAN